MLTLNKESYDFGPLISSFNSENEYFEIKYEYLDTPVNPQIELQDTSSYLCRCKVSVRNKLNGESISTVVNLLYVPIETSMGVCINWTFYSVCPLNSRAGGWYHLKKKKDNKPNSPDLITLELVPESGRSIVFEEQNGFVHVNLGTKVKKIPLGIYLKAISGLSYKDIIRKIGFRNPLIFKSFSNEKSYKECVDYLLDRLTSASKITLDDIPSAIRSQELKRLLGPRYIRLPESARSRYERTTSFVSRAIGLELLEPVLDLKAGTKLTVYDLERLDKEVESIMVLKEGKSYELRKLPMGKEFLEIDELCTELNIFFNNLEGFGYYDNMFNDLNREIVSVEELARRSIASKLGDIDSSLSTYLINPNAPLKSLEFGGIDSKLNEFMDKCKLELNNSQSAETTNGISYLGKRSKVVTNYSGNTSSDIISIKASQLSAYDLYHIPESKKVGLVWHMTLNSEINKNGEVESKFFKVVNGVVDSSEVIKLTPKDRINKIIAPWDSDLSKPIIKAYLDGNVIDASSDIVDYIELNAFNSVSLASSLIPFPQFSAGKRIVMGCSQNKQAVPCINSEAPLVDTGSLNMSTYSSELVIRAVNILDSMYRENFPKEAFNMDVYNEFMKQTLILEGLNDSKSDYMEYKFLINFMGKEYKYMLVLPFMKKGSEDVMYHYYLKHSSDRCYRGTDIVLYNNSIDIRKYDLVKYINLGQDNSVADESLFDFSTCLGVNLFTAFKTSGVPNMDDGICLSDEVLGTYKLAHVKMVEIKHEISNFKKDVTEEFGLIAPVATHDMNGLPKVGTTMLPKDKLIYKIKKNAGSVTQTYYSLPLDKEGEVAYAHIDGKTAVIGLLTVADVEVGDKLAGDHGNKGVVGRIIPKKDMPFTKDGKSIQVTLNPLGIPSRMNLSQLYVCLIGYAMKLQGKRMILSSHNPDSYEIAMEILQDDRVKTQQLFDGRTGLPFDRKTTIGYMYLKKQTHTVMSKLNSCANAESINAVTNQPNKGKSRGGGQTIGEYETWNLESLELLHTMQELFTIKSDDVSGREALLECLEQDKLYEGEMKSTNIHTKQVQLRMFGCDVSLENGKQVIKIMANDDIKGLKMNPIKPTKEGLQDDSVFGSTLSSKGVDRAKSIWSYVDLKQEIINPAFIYKGDIPRLILVEDVKLSKEKDADGNFIVETKRSNLTKSKIQRVVKGESYISIENGKIKFSKDPNLLEYPEVGITAVVKAFKQTRVSDVRRFYESLKESAKRKLLEDPRKSEDVYKLSVLLNTLDTVEQSSVDGTFSCFVIDSFPVIPKNFRYKMDNRSADLDLYYTRIFSAINQGDATAIYIAVLILLGLDSNYKLSEDTKAKNFSEMFMGKNSQDRHGLIRENVLSHKVSYSFRSVIAPGKIPLGKLGLPRQICYNLKKLELRKRLIDQYDLFERVPGLVDQFITSMQIGSLSRTIQLFTNLVDNEYERDRAKFYMENCDRIMRELLSETVVIFGRQPTLKELSMRGLEPVMVEGYAILLNVLLCSGYNADFDGDQMWGSMLHTKKSIMETKEKASPVRYMLESKDGSVALSPTQDILLGLYLATMLHGNVLDGSTRDEYKLENIVYVNRISELKNLISSGRINRKDLVCYTSRNGNKYLSTAGRILFNSIFKSGFTDEEYVNHLNLDYINPSNYKALRYDGLIKNNDSVIPYTRVEDDVEVTKQFKTISIDTVLKNEFLNYQPEELNKILDELLDFGEESCIVSGITLHLDSFKESKKSEELTARYNELVREWQELYELGLMPESEKSSLFIKASNYITSRIKKSILADYDRDEDLFIIMDSGARGNAGQLMASSGLIGIVSKSSTEQIDTPVLRSYKKGLSASDYYIMSHGTLYGVSAVQKDTGKSGEMTRDFVYMGSGIKVTETDCGCGFLDIDVVYDAPITTETELANLTLDPSSKLFDDTRFITKNGIINKDTINYIFKNKITEVPLNDGTVFTVKYKMSDMFRNMFVNKLGKDLPFMKQGNVITKETLDEVERLQMKTIKSRTVITCKTRGGICSNCYGILHNTNKVANVTYPAGVKAGQSIGEPSTQLLLDTINKNGSSDGTISAIDVCKSIIYGSVSDGFTYAIISQCDTVASVEDSGRFAIVTIGPDRYKVPRQNLKIVDGESVKIGQSISSGVVNVRDIPDCLPNFLYLRKLQQVKSLFYLFFDSNISVDARHFEVLIKAQLDYVKVYLSDCPDVKEGLIYDFSLVEEKIAEGYNIKYINEPLKRAERLLNVSGPDTALCHHDPVNIMIKMATNESIQNDKMSFIGCLYSGSDVYSGKLSTPTKPMYKEFVSQTENEKEKEEKVIKEFSDVFKPVTNNSLESMISSSKLGSLLSGIQSKSDNTPSTMDSIGSSNVFGEQPSPMDDFEIDLDSDWGEEEEVALDDIKVEEDKYDSFDEIVLEDVKPNINGSSVFSSYKPSIDDKDLEIDLGSDTDTVDYDSYDEELEELELEDI